MNKNLKPTNDFIFKKLFTKKGNEDLLIDLLNGILNTNITQIEVEKDVILEKELESNKFGILDLKATINNKEIVNIELQVINEQDMIERSLFYWSGLYHNQFRKGEKYINAKKVIVINILMFDMFKEGPFIEKAMLKRNYNQLVLTDKMEMYFIQLPKFLKQQEKEKSKLTNWLYFISQDKKGVQKAMEEDEKIKKAIEELEELIGDEKTRNQALRREMELRDEIIRNENRKEEKEDRIRAEKARRETEEIRKETERMIRENEKKIKENERIRRETEKAIKENERRRRETEQTIKETERIRRETEKAVKETERAKIEAEEKAQEAEEKAQEAEEKAQEAEEKAQEAEEKAQKAEEKLEKLVQKMIKEKINIETIEKITGLTRAEIKKKEK